MLYCSLVWLVLAVRVSPTHMFTTAKCAIMADLMDSPLNRYHISSDAGALSILGYQHHNLDEPSLIALNWFSADRTN